MIIKSNLEKIRNSIANNIVILAATKKQSIERIDQAISSGIKVIGENYVQDAEKKYQFLRGKVEIHCIGHLQSNKVKKAVELFDMIQTVDSERIAKEIDKQSKKINKTMPILIEVNIAKEENKDGCLPENVKSLARYIFTLKNIRLKGLMTMAPYFKDSEKARPHFKEAKKLFDKLKKLYPDIDILSMGMSDSYKVAVEEGATMVRIGTNIFGER